MPHASAVQTVAYTLPLSPQCLPRSSPSLLSTCYRIKILTSLSPSQASRCGNNKFLARKLIFPLYGNTSTLNAAKKKRDGDSRNMQQK